MTTASFKEYTITRRPGLTFYTPRCFTFTRNGKAVKNVDKLIRDQLIRRVMQKEYADFNAA